MTEGGPLVTIIVAVRNGEATIQRALDSVFEQTYGRIALIVMDGASTDATPAILERNADRIAYWESEPDRGVYHAWNKALAHATGEWILFLGADDRLAAPDVIERMVPALEAASGRVRVVYGSVDVVDQQGSLLRRIGDPWDVAGPAFTDHMSIPHPATFHRRVLFQAHGRFDEGFRIAGDYEFLLRDVLQHEPVFVSDLVVVAMGAGGLSDRPDNAATIVLEVHRARRRHGITTTPEWRSFSVLRDVGHARSTRLFGARATRVVTIGYRLISRPFRGRRNP